MSIMRKAVCLPLHFNMEVQEILQTKAIHYVFMEVLTGIGENGWRRKIKEATGEGEEKEVWVQCLLKTKIRERKNAKYLVDQVSVKLELAEQNSMNGWQRLEGLPSKSEQTNGQQ